MNLSTWPSYDDKDIADVSAVLASGRVNQWTGHHVKEFEREFARWLGCEYAAAVSNGTVALELALRALIIGPGDEVIVSSRSYFASASAIVAVGARPVFCDIDIDSGNMSAETVLPHITNKTKAILAVHIGGLPCDMDPILKIARNHGLKVVEDCAQAHGAKYRGRNVGTLGDVSCWSFCQDKILSTAGEGGMITTNFLHVHEFVNSYKDHGKKFGKISNSNVFGFKYLHDQFGSNYRMTEIQAAVGRNQLLRLDEWIEVRNRNSSILTSYLSEFEFLRFPSISQASAGCGVDVNAYYKFYLFLDLKFVKNVMTRDALGTEIVSSGIPCFSGSCAEIYLEDAFLQTNFRPDLRFKNASIISDTSLMFLVHPTLTDEQMHFIGKTIQGIFTRYR
jgi:dTDP-4-amino-4,6-dideoxygalactose transaminase